MTVHEGLSDEWRRWIVRALRAGATGPEIVEGLCEEGVPRALAEIELDTIASATTELRAQVERLRLGLRLLGELEPGHVEVRATCTHNEFYAHYYSANRPLLLRGLCRQWPSVREWTPTWLKAEYGDVIVEVNAERDADPARIQRPHEHSREIRFGDFIDMIERERGNDVYMVSRNRALEGPLGRLLDGHEAHLPDWMDRSAIRRSSLWIGPAGTFTPFHHDTANILFCQIYGTKRVRLVSPRHPEFLLGPAEADFYPRLEEDADPPALAVELTAGDALFLPVGWWHEVRSGSLSISLSFTNFRGDNRFDWYRPGRCLG